MAAIPVTYVGQDQDGKDFRFVGMMSLTGFAPGHPLPDPPPGGGGPPPIIWPGPGPLPGVGHPIVLPGDPSWEPPTLPPDGPPANAFDWQLHATWDETTTPPSWKTVVIGIPTDSGPPLPTPAGS